MKVVIGPYQNWIGPYQIAEKILFWMDRYDDDRVHDFGTWLDKNIPGLTKFCHWVESKRKRKIKIRIDKYDTWSMDHTLALIALPMLKQLRDTKHGSPQVDIEDVPEELRIVGHEDWSSQLELKFEDHEQYEKDSWNITHRRWDWVLGEIIFAFECVLNDDWDEQFWSGEWGEMIFEDTDDSNLKSLKNTGNRTCDWKARQEVEDRISNGLRLFGKYYRGLWD